MDERTAIKKGFNAGYWMEKYEPELAKILQESFGDPEHPYAKGFVMGSREFVQEQFSSSSKEDTGIEIGFEKNDLPQTLKQDFRRDDPEWEK